MTENGYSENWYIFRGSVALFVTIGIIFSNVINLIVWKKNKRMPTATRLFLINLSTSDLLVGILSTAPAIYPAFKGSWPYGHIWCQISGVAHGMSVTLSIWSIAMVGIDRYFAATKPYKYKTLMSRKRTFIIVGCMWVAAFATYIAPIFTKKNFIYYAYKNHDAFCGLHWEYPLYCIITGFYIPIASASVLIFTSVQIHRNLVANKKHSKQQNSDEQQQPSNNTSTEKYSKKMDAINQRALLILITAAAVFFAFWGPYVIVVVSQSFYSKFEVSDEVKFCLIWVANANSMVNVFVYSLTNKSFLEEAKLLLLNCHSKKISETANKIEERRNSWQLVNSPENGHVDFESIAPGDNHEFPEIVHKDHDNNKSDNYISGKTQITIDPNDVDFKI